MRSKSQPSSDPKPTIFLGILGVGAGVGGGGAGVHVKVMGKPECSRD